MRLYLSFFLLIFSTLPAAEFAPVFTYDAVLQRDQPIALWGTGRDGEQVTVELLDKSAFRTASLVRGKHPCVLILDDVDKGDGHEHAYDSVMQVPSSVRLADIQLTKGSPAAAVLIKAPRGDQWRIPDVQNAPVGTPALLDVPVTTGSQLWNFFKATEQPIRLDVRTYTSEQPEKIITRNRLYVTRRDNALRSRIALIPFKISEPIPRITWDGARSTATLAWPEQNNAVALSAVDAADRTRVTILRDGAEILSSAL